MSFPRPAHSNEVSFLTLSNTQPPPPQEEKTWLTPLHISLRRGLLETAKYLISVGADVNAVAGGDVMPLSLAEALPESNDKDEIVSLLTRR
jgi:ankyrin repeat protein